MPNTDIAPAILRLLILALGPLGAGKVVQELVNSLSAAAPEPLTGDQKFYLAILVSFVVPIAAYGLLVWLGGAPFDLATLVWEIGVGYIVSQKYHRDAKKEQAARQSIPFTIVPPVERAPEESSAPQTVDLDPLGEHSSSVE
jgi:hypothetical protein